MSEKGKGILGSFQVCPICGKRYWVPVFTEWAYKKYINGSTRLFCSWKCFREHENICAEKKRQKLIELRKGVVAENRAERHQEQLSTVLAVISRSGGLGTTSYEMQDGAKELYGNTYSRPVILRLIRELVELGAIKKIEPRDKCQVYVAVTDKEE